MNRKEEQARLATARKIIQELEQALSPEATLAQAQVFLSAAERPAATLSDLVNATGQHKATVSRSVRLMTDRLGEREGYRLLTQEADRADARRKPLLLTRKGREVTEKLAKIIAQAELAES